MKVEDFRKIPLRTGMVFMVKPRVRSASTKRSAQMGESIVVRSNGGEQLGKRKLELRVV